MKNNNNTLLILLTLSTTTFGMEVEISQQQKKQTLTEFFSSNKNITDYIDKNFQDLDRKEWWYLSQKHAQDISVHPAYFDSTKKFLASHTGDYKAVIYNQETKQDCIIFPHKQWVWSVSFDPTDTLLATGSIDRKARIFDIERGKKIASIPHNESVTVVSFDKTGNLLTETRPGEISVFTKYTAWTNEQYLLKTLFFVWSKESKQLINSSDTDILNNIATECNLEKTELENILKTFPLGMQSALFKIIQKECSKQNKETLKDPSPMDL